MHASQAHLHEIGDPVGRQHGLTLKCTVLLQLQKEEATRGLYAPEWNHLAEMLATTFSNCWIPRTPHYSTMHAWTDQRRNSPFIRIVNPVIQVSKGVLPLHAIVAIEALKLYSK